MIESFLLLTQDNVRSAVPGTFTKTINVSRDRENTLGGGF